MGLNVYLTKVMPCEVFCANITHNLNKMATAAGIYNCLWRPEEIGIKVAGELIEPLKIGLQKLKDNPEYFKQFNPPNNWGTYDYFVPWVEKYLQACIDNPDAEIRVSR